MLGLAACSSDEPDDTQSTDAAVMADASAPEASAPAINDAGAPTQSSGQSDASADMAGSLADAAATESDGGRACIVSSDCTNSPEAARIKDLRCPSEVYCLAGRCKAACSPACRELREDVNPCDDGAYCDGALKVCRFRPAKCLNVSSCPKFRPPLPDGGLGTWTCENGACAYPGFEYASQD